MVFAMLEVHSGIIVFTAVSVRPTYAVLEVYYVADLRRLCLQLKHTVWE